MTTNEKALQLVKEAIDELNEQLPKEEKIEKSANTILLGSGGGLDSLRLISLVTTVEQKIEEKFGVTTALLEDIDLLENDNPFKSVQDFSDYIASILEKNAID